MGRSRTQENSNLGLNSGSRTTISNAPTKIGCYNRSPRKLYSDFWVQSIAPCASPPSRCLLLAWTENPWSWTLLLVSCLENRANSVPTPVGSFEFVIVTFWAFVHVHNAIVYNAISLLPRAQDEFRKAGVLFEIQIIRLGRIRQLFARYVDWNMERSEIASRRESTILVISNVDL